MQTLSFVAFLVAGVALYWSPIVGLSHLVDKSELYSHIPLIPLVSGYFLIIHRNKIFGNVGWDYWKGMVLLGLAGLIRWLAEAWSQNPSPNDYLSLYMLGFVIWVQGCFVFSYGVSGLKRALFPLMFLVFLIPIPAFILNPFVQFLQLGSTKAAALIFKLTGVPVYRDGFVFSLPGFTIEVAKECSGIRSSIALFITAILAGKLFLENGLSRLILALTIIPVSMFKNGLRIVTLGLLASSVDPRFVTNSWLHKSGGIPFFAIGLLLLLPVVWGLRKGEKRKLIADGSEQEGQKARRLES